MKAAEKPKGTESLWSDITKKVFNTLAGKFDSIFSAAVCDNMKIFQVDDDDGSTKTDNKSISDEFDHFYD